LLTWPLTFRIGIAGPTSPTPPNIANLKGDALADASMKAETNAKGELRSRWWARQFHLAETEIETIPEKAKQPPAPKLR
jgi:hypothetical protein